MHASRRVVEITLPEESRGQVCRFRWWQPVHSGDGVDVWALDGITLADRVHTILTVNFTDRTSVSQTLDVHGGTIAAYCGRPNVLV